MKKLIGIAGFSWVTVKLGLTSLPHGLNFKHIVGVALMGGGILNQDIFLVGERPLWVGSGHRVSKSCLKSQTKKVRLLFLILLEFTVFGLLMEANKGMF